MATRLTRRTPPLQNLLIANARLVNEGSIREADLLVRGERIERIDAAIAAPDGAEVIDAAGKLLLPGMIDDQVHFREPGLTHKGDLASESAAAVAGGITSFMDMPNVNPLTTTREALADKYRIAGGRCAANYAFYFGATNDNIEEIRALRPEDACGIKVFMGASTGNMLVDDDDALENIFAGAPLLVVTHCEDSPLIEANEQTARARWGERVPFREHPALRSADACLKSSAKAIDLARRHDARLHVLHLTTAVEMPQFEPGPLTGKRITAEVCVHHLWFDDSRYDELGAAIKCNPAIKSASDRAALIKALNDDRIDIIATDHAPHTLEEKPDDYFKAAAGLPLVQHALPALLELAAREQIGLPLIVQKVCHAPAELFGIEDRGYLREGCFADLVLVDPDDPKIVERDSVLYKCGWSPFEGQRFSSSIDTTIVNGEVVYRDDALTGAAAGQALICNSRR